MTKDDRRARTEACGGKESAYLYTKQEVDELTRWFEERMDRLPATLQLNEATAASDLPRTVKALLAVLKVHKENISVTFSGYMSHLDLIRLRLKEQGLE